jgi:hypothetical protein
MRCAVQFAGEILAAEFRRSLLDLTYNGKSRSWIIDGEAPPRPC